MAQVRRVVTETDAGGTSRVRSDGAPAVVLGGDGSTSGISILWETPLELTYEQMGGDPENITMTPSPGVARFVRLVIPPGADSGAPQIPAHRTDTLDLLVVADGEVELILDASPVVLRAGDALVMQGDVHGWRNVGDTPCVVVATMIGAPERTS
jgi:quercetin dioxygenase-like cupin family protein